MGNTSLKQNLNCIVFKAIKPNLNQKKFYFQSIIIISVAKFSVAPDLQIKFGIQVQNATYNILITKIIGTSGTL
jgi:hypothetical protein